MQQDLPLGTQIYTANTFRCIFEIVNISHSQSKYRKTNRSRGQSVNDFHYYPSLHTDWKYSLFDLAYHLGHVLKHKI